MKKVFILFCMLVSLVFASDSSFDEVLAKAKQGDAEAQFLLGLMYDQGQGVKQDYEKAAEWFSKAANQGYAKAQYNLGAMYENGQAVRQDYKKAFEWYSKAANQGYAKAQYNLGAMYEKGYGVRQDLKKAKEYFGLSCDSGLQLGCDAYRELNERGI
ncbi:tetratricopeptide repeat protein [Helicobacter sp.]|uniref:tetratricopeptide repeat protein n=1 Tax=Helicobacter sp. TaxID=218 RepID=UPI002588F9C7|nr:tetratricopeptide repeat protein [Helicobacter sp.]MCI7046793.1 sel1 repeat family protein [Helicobacter sp.]